MPHIPRDIGLSSKTDYSSDPKNIGTKPAVPYRPAKQVQDVNTTSLRETLSVWNFNVDPNRVYEHLTGQKPSIDDHTKQLV
jgi:hypothetical protein